MKNWIESVFIAWNKTNHTIAQEIRNKFCGRLDETEETIRGKNQIQENIRFSSEFIRINEISFCFLVTIRSMSLRDNLLWIVTLTFMLNKPTITIRISCIINLATTWCHVINNSALSILTTNSCTWITAFISNTRFIRWTICVYNTLWPTNFVWIAIKFCWTLAWANTILFTTFCICTTRTWSTGSKNSDWNSIDWKLWFLCF